MKIKIELVARNKLSYPYDTLTVSYDMGWNKRSTVTRYDSVSGHGIILGARTKKLIGYGE